MHLIWSKLTKINKFESDLVFAHQFGFFNNESSIAGETIYNNLIKTMMFRRLRADSYQIPATLFHLSNIEVQINFEVQNFRAVKFHPPKYLVLTLYRSLTFIPH